MLTDKELEEIRRKLLELEEAPPADGWKSIRAEIQPPTKAWRPVWWVGAILLLLLTGTGLYFMLDKKADAPQQAATKVAAPAKIAAATVDEAQQVRPETAETRHSKRSQTREPATNSKQAEIITQSKTEGTGKPAAVVQPETKGSIGQEPNQFSRNPSGKTIRLPIAPVDSVVRRKATAETPELYTFAATPDSVKKEAKKPVAETIAPTIAVEPDSSQTEPASTALFLAVADSVATSVAPDSSSQDRKPAAKSKKERPTLHNSSGWAVGAYLAPRYAFRKFTPNAEDNILITRLNTKSQLDPERMGYEAGISISKSVKPNLTLETGLSVVNLKENVDYTYTAGEVGGSNMRQTPDGSIVVDAIQVTEDRRLVSSYTYGGFRLGVNYYFLETLRSRLNVSFAGGMNLLLKGETKEYRNGEWLETIVFPDKDNLLEQSNYNLLLGIGYNVALHPKYELTVMPALNYFLGSTFKEREPFGLRPYTLGVNLQVRRSLGW